jgi:cytochrome P450
MFGDGIFTQEGASWKHSRELLRPEFAHKHYDGLEVFRQSVDDLIAAVPKSGGVTDLQPLFFRLTLDITTAFLFGESVQSLRSPDTAGEKSFADAFNTAQEYVAKRFRLLDLYWMIGGTKFRRACTTVHEFADHIIDRNLQKKRNHDAGFGNDTFLDAVARSMPDREALRSQIINILVAGRDTTACLLSWTLYDTLPYCCLGQNQADRESPVSLSSDTLGSWTSSVQKSMMHL